MRWCLGNFVEEKKDGRNKEVRVVNYIRKYVKLINFGLEGFIKIDLLIIKS